ncbi:MAG: hypothetical protein M4D80_26675 [Myxococcota bacterium]|nr:hypothetical protein [Deltaproteobacteria bacterium]MDQ3338767.1 hypothetical protein [Myxococcota bacterium]
MRGWILLAVLAIALLFLVGREHSTPPAATGKPVQPPAQPSPQPTAQPAAQQQPSTATLAAARTADLSQLRLRLEAARVMAAARARVLTEMPIGQRPPMSSNEIEDALTESMKQMMSCWPYKKGEGARVDLVFVLLSDPELGLFVDTPPSLDENTNKPFDPTIDDCIRDVIDGLELPGTRVFAKTTEHWHFDFDNDLP